MFKFNVFLVTAFVINSVVEGQAITNANFNSNIRDYSVKDDEINSTKVRTLQKEEAGRHANLAAVRSPIRFKEIPDNALSSSSYSRGLLLHDHSVYDAHDYEETPHGHIYGHGYDYHDGDHHDYPYDHHVPVHHVHSDHHGHHDHHLSYDHHKHHHHALAAKTVLWPIAGIALLGAAAALVSNPVLLQLGVVSGKRRRRNTEDEPNVLIRKLAIPNQHEIDQVKRHLAQDTVEPKVRTLRLKRLKKYVQSENVPLDIPKGYDMDSNEYRNFVPIPIQIRN